MPSLMIMTSVWSMPVSWQTCDAGFYRLRLRDCRKMELAVWTDPKVSDIINNDYVLITLYVDNKTPLPSPVKIVENGTERTLRTVGDKWSYLQRVKFGANAQPFYVLINNEGEPLNKSYSYDESIPKYIEFLQTGLENYRKEK